jgi:protein-S-isoprenylcysteine O-methyltransferase Ste14
MTGSVAVQRSQLLHAAAGVALATIWALFAYRHIDVFLRTGAWPYLVFCVSETLQAGLFLARYQPVSVSNNPMDWVVAVVGTVTPLFLVPSDTGSHIGTFILIGTCLQILGLLSLNRSFAIVAARRRIRTSGMYRVVRHPIYASYLVLLFGYLWTTPSAWNIALVSLVVVCIVARIIAEERHLSEDESYVRYTAQVRYRLMPFVF